MPNAFTHTQYAKVAVRLVLNHGLAPAARDLLREGHREFFEAAALPDLVTEIGCDMPGGLKTTVVKNLASLGHFQCVTRGYRFLDDRSLWIGAEIVAAAGGLADVRICRGTDQVPVPLSGLLEDTPFVQALERQPSATIGTFRFPSAAEQADYWCRSVVHWLREPQPNLVAARRAAGMGSHYKVDAGAPHHARGVLLDGHQPFEDALEHETDVFLRGIEATDMWGMLAQKVLAEMVAIDSTTASDLCLEQATWALKVFGDRGELATCPGDVATRMLERSLAAILRGLEIEMGAA